MLLFGPHLRSQPQGLRSSAVRSFRACATIRVYNSSLFRTNSRCTPMLFFFKMNIFFCVGRPPCAFFWPPATENPDPQLPKFFNTLAHRQSSQTQSEICVSVGQRRGDVSRRRPKAAEGFGTEVRRRPPSADGHRATRMSRKPYVL